MANLKTHGNLNTKTSQELSQKRASNMSHLLPDVQARRSVEVHGGGRGGAANAGSHSTRQYVDGGLYRTESPGADGKPYSTGRGGAGNIGEGTPRESMTGSEARDVYPQESVVNAREGEAASGGRGGAGNIGEITSQDRIQTPGSHASPMSNEQAQNEEDLPVHGKEKNPHIERRRLSSGMSHLGLADKMKFGLLSMAKKS